MKTITIEVPDDCEVQVVKKESIIRTYQDLINNDIELHGFYITNQSWISHINGRALNSNKLIAASEKVAKSMFAMAQISQLMPYYGGEIDNGMWIYPNTKYVIRKVGNRVIADNTEHSYHFLAFHTEEQRNEFLKYNEQLVKDYLMINYV